MRFVFRGLVVFEYNPDTKRVILGRLDGEANFDTNCNLIPEDYKLISEFFNIVYRHINGENVFLKDFEVY